MGFQMQKRSRHLGWLVGGAVVLVVGLGALGAGLWLRLQTPGPPDALEVVSASWEPGSTPRIKATFRLRRRDGRPVQLGGATVGLPAEQDKFRVEEALDQVPNEPEFTYTASFRTLPPQPVRVRVTPLKVALLSLNSPSTTTEDAPRELFTQEILLPELKQPAADGVRTRIPSDGQRQEPRRPHAP